MATSHQAERCGKADAEDNLAFHVGAISERPNEKHRQRPNQNRYHRALLGLVPKSGESLLSRAAVVRLPVIPDHPGLVP
jgi:hypothetical protein